MVRGLKGFRVSGFLGFWVEGFRVLRLEGFRVLRLGGLGVWGFGGLGVPSVLDVSGDPWAGGAGAHPPLQQAVDESRLADVREPDGCCSHLEQREWQK